MESGSKNSRPLYEISVGQDDLLKPMTLVLKDRFMVSEAAIEAPLYELSWSITSIPQKGTSVKFDRAENDNPLEAKDGISTEQQNQHLFYLAHPAGAQFQSDSPAYYLTSVSPGMLGNIHLEASKSRFQKPELKALLSTEKSWSDSPLFDKEPKLLFDLKPKWMGGGYTWADSTGKQVAYEDGKGDQQRLVITAPMSMRVRDALAATWCLKLWRDTAESGQAKRDAMENLTDANSLRGFRSSALAKRVGAAGSLAGAGA